MSPKKKKKKSQKINRCCFSYVGANSGSVFFFSVLVFHKGFEVHSALSSTYYLSMAGVCLCLYVAMFLYLYRDQMSFQG